MTRLDEALADLAELALAAAQGVVAGVGLAIVLFAGLFVVVGIKIWWEER